jgi:hypothetical protein
MDPEVQDYAFSSPFAVEEAKTKITHLQDN